MAAKSRRIQSATLAVSAMVRAGQASDALKKRVVIQSAERNAGGVQSAQRILEFRVSRLDSFEYTLEPTGIEIAVGSAKSAADEFRSAEEIIEVTGIQLGLPCGDLIGADGRFLLSKGETVLNEPLPGERGNLVIGQSNTDATTDDGDKFAAASGFLQFKKVVRFTRF